MKESMREYNSFEREQEEIQDEMTACYSECASCKHRYNCKLGY
jgi:hypothetical protein